MHRKTERLWWQQLCPAAASSGFHRRHAEMGTGASIPAEAAKWTVAEAKEAGYTDEQIAQYQAAGEVEKAAAAAATPRADAAAAAKGLKKTSSAAAAAKSKTALSAKAKVGAAGAKKPALGDAKKPALGGAKKPALGGAAAKKAGGSLLGATSAGKKPAAGGKKPTGWAGGAAKKGKKGGAKKKKAEEPEPEPTPEELAAAAAKEEEEEAAAAKAKEEQEARKIAALQAIEDEKAAEENRRYQQEAMRERKQREMEKKRFQAKADMIEAAFDGEMDDLKKFVEDPSLKLRIDESDENDYTSLSEAACAGHVDIVKYLLEKGANPNSVGKHKRTPIWRAVYMNQIECITPLLDAGADARKTSSDGDDAILLATSHARKEITAIFAGWDPSKADKINSDFEAKIAAQKKRDDLEEKAREFALTQTYSSELSVAVDNEAIEKMINKLSANKAGELSLDEFISGWSAEYPADKEAKPPNLLEFEGLAEALKSSAEADRAVLVVDPTQRASRYLQYNANVIDAKGLLILDKINGKPEEDIKEELRKIIVQGMHFSKTLQFECQNTAPPFGEYEDDDSFPISELCKEGWNAASNEEVIEALMREDDEFQGHNFVNNKVHLVFTTYHLLRGICIRNKANAPDFGSKLCIHIPRSRYFEPGNYKEFLKGGWAEWPFNDLDIYIVM